MCARNSVTAWKYVHYFQLNWWVQRAGKNIAKMYIYAKINNYLRAAVQQRSAITRPQEAGGRLVAIDVCGGGVWSRECQESIQSSHTVSFNQGLELLHPPHRLPLPVQRLFRIFKWLTASILTEPIPPTDLISAREPIKKRCTKFHKTNHRWAAKYKWKQHSLVGKMLD